MDAYELYWFRQVVFAITAQDARLVKSSKELLQHFGLKTTAYAVTDRLFVLKSCRQIARCPAQLKQRHQASEHWVNCRCRGWRREYRGSLRLSRLAPM